MVNSCTEGMGSGRMLKYRLLVLLLTFLTYSSYHMSRKPASIVKSSLHPYTQSDAKGSYNPDSNPGWPPFSNDLIPSVVAKSGYSVQGSSVCNVNNDFKCNKPTDSWCSSYLSGDGKFTLHYAANETACSHTNTPSCWVISAVPKNLNAEENRIFCRNATKNEEEEEEGSLDCSMYAQSGGYLLPQSKDDDQKEFNWTILFQHESNSVKLVAGVVTVSPKETNGKFLLGVCDSIYLAMYAFGMFFSGHIADHMSLRVFLSIGMLGSGLLVCMVGFAEKFGAHDTWYFYLVYGLQGLFQSTGWPAVVAVMSNWFGKGTRGLVMGVWNAHTSVGNILGSVLSGLALKTGLDGNNWPAAFYLTGGLIATMGVVVFFFLPNQPSDVGLQMEEEEEEQDSEEDSSINGFHALPNNPDAPNETGGGPAKRNSFLKALFIPGVIEFAMSLFFCKFVAYMFIYWLPLYLNNIGFSTANAANLSTAFDVGGIVGGIIAGWASDKLKRRAPVAFAYLALAVPGCYFYREISDNLGSSNIGYNILLMLVCGALVNGPYALITTAVSADLGNHPSLKGDLTLAATVTGIIDGTGSLGASIQGVLIGKVSSAYGWNAVFYLLMISSSCSALCLFRLVWKQTRRVGHIILVLFSLGGVAIIIDSLYQVLVSDLGSCVTV